MIFCKKKSIILLGNSVLIILFLMAFKYLLSPEKNYAKESSYLIFSKASGFYEEAFELELTSNSGTIYYTLDGTLPDNTSIKYEKPILITDATNLDNTYSMRTDVSTGFEKEEIEKHSADYPGYQVPDYKIDKAVIVRAVTYDETRDTYSEVKTASYFIGFSQKNGYDNMKILSIVTDPSNLFDYETGIYVTGKAYGEYVKEYRNSDDYYWREEFWTLWMANYRNRGIKWEKKAWCQFFDESGQQVLEQECGIRIHGASTRAYNPKSLNIYAREEYDGSKALQYDFWGTGYYPAEVTLSQGGNDQRTKSKDYLISETVKDLNVSTMNYEPYVLFLNGEYWGIYWLNEKYNAQYIGYYYDVDCDNVIMIKQDGLEEGSEGEDDKYYYKMVEFCSKSNVAEAENYQKVCELVDMESYLDYYAVMLYLGRRDDWPGGNFALWRVKKTEEGPFGDGKWRWMMYDFNSPGYGVNFDSIEYAMERDEMFKNLMTNGTFREQLLCRIEELSDTVFDFEDMDVNINEFQMFIAEPMKENDRRFYNDGSLDVFNEEIESLRHFLQKEKQIFFLYIGKIQITTPGTLVRNQTSSDIHQMFF